MQSQVTSVLAGHDYHKNDYKIVLRSFSNATLSTSCFSIGFPTLRVSLRQSQFFSQMPSQAAAILAKERLPQK
jgi:hypothetical protein